MGDEELNQDELDLAQFASLLDTCLTSDNEAVQNALRGLLTIATIVTAKKPGDELVRGPLRKLVDQVQNLQNKVTQLDLEVAQTRNRNGHYGRPDYPDKVYLGPGKDYYESPSPTFGPGQIDPNYNKRSRPFIIGDNVSDKGATSVGTSASGGTLNIDMLTEMMRKLKE